MIRAAMNICVQILGWTSVFSSLGYLPRSGSYGNSMFNLMKNQYKAHWRQLLTSISETSKQRPRMASTTTYTMSTLNSLTPTQMCSMGRPYTHAFDVWWTFLPEYLTVPQMKSAWNRTLSLTHPRNSSLSYFPSQQMTPPSHQPSAGHHLWSLKEWCHY